MRQHFFISVLAVAVLSSVLTGCSGVPNSGQAATTDQTATTTQAGAAAPFAGEKATTTEVKPEKKGLFGSSKSLVDIGSEGQAVLSFLTHLNQIGQTGSTPRHPKGLAACCHGEEPHTVGWRFIKERRAISLDANCGWARGKADVVYVADAFAVMKKVNELLAK